MTLTQEQTYALTIARQLTEAGIPIYLARPDPESRGVGYKLPWKWQDSEPDPSIVDKWQPGYAVCMVTGHGFDGLDVDPRSGGSLDNMPFAAPTIYAVANTPSGGVHYLVASLGVHSRDGIFQGVDLKAGVPGPAGGRGFLFIAPTVRQSKVDGQWRPYTWQTVPMAMPVAGPDSEPLRNHVAALRSHERFSLTHGSEVPKSKWEQSCKRVRAELVALVDRYKDESSWGGDAHAALLRITTNMARLAPDYALETAHDVFASFGLTVDERVETMIRDALAKYPPDDVLDEDNLTDDELFWLGWSRPKVNLSDLTAHNGRISTNFWDSRASLQHIRQAAYSRRVQPEAVLMNMLSMLSARCSPYDRVDLNTGDGQFPVTVFTITVAKPGQGKSMSRRVAEDLLPLPIWFQRGQNYIQGSTPTGQGIIAMYSDGAVKGQAPEQVRYNAEIFVDEGASFISEIERPGSNLGAVVREAWTGVPLGNTNAELARRRRADLYSLGINMLFQWLHLDQLFSGNESGSGTPHRFLYCEATRQGTPRARPPFPGALPFRDYSEPATVVNAGEGSGLATGGPETRPQLFMVLDETLRNEIAQYTNDVIEGNIEVTEMNEHAYQYRGRVAAMLARLDSREPTRLRSEDGFEYDVFEITVDDWILAGAVMQMSDGIRVKAVADAKRRADLSENSYKERLVGRQTAIAAATLEVQEKHTEAKIIRSAANAARRVLNTVGNSCTKSELHHAIGGRRTREEKEEAINFAIDNGWLLPQGDRYVLGPQAVDVPAG